MERRNAEPVDRERFQVRGAAITKLFQAPMDPHLKPWQVHVHLFTMNRMSVHVIRFAIQQFSLQTSAESFGTEDEPNKGSGLILEIFAGSCRFSKACKNLGFRVLAVDKNPKRAENFPVASFDLTRPQFASSLKRSAKTFCWHILRRVVVQPQKQENARSQAFPIRLDLSVVSHTQTGWPV